MTRSDRLSHKSIKDKGLIVTNILFMTERRTSTNYATQDITRQPTGSGQLILFSLLQGVREREGESSSMKR